MIFIHDHTFIKRDEKYYTSGSLNNNLFERYVQWFGNVEIIANERLATEKDDRIICEQNAVDCVKLTLFKKSNNILNILKNRKIIEQAVSKNECLVIRIPSIYGIMAVNYARKLNKPYLVEVVGCAWDSLWNHGWKGKIIAPYMWFATKKVAKNAAYAVYVTNKFLQRRYPCKGKTLGCSDVALPPLSESILERRLNKIKQMTENRPIVLGTTAAVNVRYKGQEYVIKAISKLNKEGYNFEYHLVGGGDNSYLRSVAEKYNVVDKVKFLGSLPHDKVFEYLDDIDIYIQPSKQEGLPRALVEAMSRGCPVLGSKTGGIPELLNDKFIFRKGSVEDIVTLIKKMNQEKMKEEAIRSFQKAKEYDSSVLDKKRMEFYQDFINQRMIL
jgi:glycosyltransferase involved in cell wall biosynthesis